MSRRNEPEQHQPAETPTLEELHARFAIEIHEHDPSLPPEEVSNLSADLAFLARIAQRLEIDLPIDFSDFVIDPQRWLEDCRSRVIPSGIAQQLRHYLLLLLHPLPWVLAAIVYMGAVFIWGSGNALGFWPWGRVTAPVGECGFTTDAGLDLWLAAAWATFVAALVALWRKPEWAVPLTSTALAISILAGSLAGARWYDAVLTNSFNDERFAAAATERDCSPVPTETVLASLDERLLYRVAILVALSSVTLALLAVRKNAGRMFEFRLNPPSKRRKRRIWVVTISAGAIAAIPVIQALRLQIKFGDETDWLPFGILLSWLLLAAFTAVLPTPFFQHVGRSICGITLGLAFAQLGTALAIEDQHLTAKVTRIPPDIILKADITQAQIDVLQDAIQIYVLFVAAAALIWVLSRASEWLLRVPGGEEEPTAVSDASDEDPS